MTTGAGITGFISIISELVTGSVSWMTTVVSWIVDTPLVLMFCLVGFLGVGISLVRRFF